MRFIQKAIVLYFLNEPVNIAVNLKENSDFVFLISLASLEI